MEHLSETAAFADDVWTTPQVASFLDISRQAINKRVRSRKMLGYAGDGVTLFPVWQFDSETHTIHPEVPEFLAVFDEDIEPAAIALWAITKVDGFDRTPAELLLDPETKDDALRLAGTCTTGSIEEHPALQAEPDPEIAEKKIAEWRPTRPGASGAQEAILLAAADLFARKGPAKVTLREVAAAADVSYGLIHRFYRTKENLLVTVMELLVGYGGDRLTAEKDAYDAIDNSIGADLDSGQFGRMLMWSIFEGIEPDRLLGEARSRGYRQHIEALWKNPTPPKIRDEFDPSVVAALLGVVGSVWDLYEPYMIELSDNRWRSREDLRREVSDLLKLLVYAARPDR
ncbi:TetR/AcrR family transcriptional regulator [Rhodococcus rhodochrous]|uniref:TetR/AcrR family transcriptional regulator n=1 Tax=Rhodococcus rhodochrous TaxID=1829 RepID=UPI001E386B2A|nr:helix-turn-helix domain-containing protein [Rhodococcus rhodochrous]MCD2097490.1 TetR/AcrR family transcriptional regulator [Rhodococcus rhodochrous]MCD2122594.1 TetR/AcrR family transcriptional regulator [Rhodococcus rhodochrous]MCQ4133602.1 TetR/AcrR family transcriptional regulator [Rhodococcus rhodochrous]MDJ0018106.1 helix-turn-helix domain-containing protein [Rhodococcus rhodochrous]